LDGLRRREVTLFGGVLKGDRMLNWLERTSLKARINMNTKESVWDIQGMSPENSGKLLAVHAYMRKILYESSNYPAIMRDIFLNPTAYPGEELSIHYTQVENIRNAQIIERERNQRQSRHLGISVPVILHEHAKRSERATNIILCTIGTGILPNVLADVRLMWRHLSSSQDRVEVSIMEIRKLEAHI
jgi:hypothetical protein